MKKRHLSSIIALLLAFVNISFAQQQFCDTGQAIPKDSLQDLWIVTIDLSKSMVDSHVSQGLPSIPKKIKDLILSYAYQPDKDMFVLQRSGANKDKLLTRNRDNKQYDKNELVADLIHKTERIESFDLLIRQLNQICANRSSFNYNMSFTSLVRPLSIYVLSKKLNFDFSAYRKIYHILITDDGDINDQWMQDYKWMEKWAPKNFNCYDTILPTIACSEYDFTSRKAGKFIEVKTLKSTQPHIYLTEYVTFQDSHPEATLPVDSLFQVSDFHNNAFTLSMKECDSSIVLTYISTCMVNGNQIEVNRYLYPNDTIVITFDETFGNALHNHISVQGDYQETYNDRILGQRPRKVSFEGTLSDNFISYETRKTGRHILLAAIGILLLIIAFIIRWQRRFVLHIYTNGKCWGIKRKAMNLLKHDNYTLLTVICDGYHVTDALFYKDEGIVIADDNSMTNTRENKIFIKSSRPLTLHSLKLEHIPLDTKGKSHFVNIDPETKGSSLSFTYSDQLSHNLIISIEAEQDVPRQCGSNDLQLRNLNMLARYYETHSEQINSVRNNVMVCLIKRNTLDGNFKQDYAVLNIFDLNSQGIANRIFLRYSMMCHIDADTTYTKLLEIAKHVLRSEHQKPGFFDKWLYDDNENLASNIMVDINPMLSYLYLLSKKEKRLVYSPFTDGRLDLTSKTVKIFPSATMSLVNLPLKHDHPEIKKDNNPTTMMFEPCPKKTETLFFHGDCKVTFFYEDRNYANGIPGASIDGPTHSSWDLNDNIFDFIFRESSNQS